ncbi:unnamed protein product [Heterobilharzia americana]|nr:unnamed protein product [Heterobilharzia americana]
MQKHSKRNSQSLSENNDNESQEDDKVESVHTEPLNKQPKLTLFKQNLFNDAKISDIEQQKETEKEQYIINKRSKTILLINQTINQ